VDGIRLWLWQYTDEFGKRRVTRWRFRRDGSPVYRDAVKVEGLLKLEEQVARITPRTFGSALMAQLLSEPPEKSHFPRLPAHSDVFRPAEHSPFAHAEEHPFGLQS
jgi:hypothetical protein